MAKPKTPGPPRPGPKSQGPPRPRSKSQGPQPQPQPQPPPPARPASTDSSNFPFYSQTTYVPVEYVDTARKKSNIDLPLVTLPAGTVLFRGIKLPEKAKSRELFTDYLGAPEGDDKVCLSPTQNVFFYPFPTVAFGVDRVGPKYQAIQIVVLVHSVTLVSTIGPSKLVRGSTKSFSGTAPIQRCGAENKKKVEPLAPPCHPLTQKELEALPYDNCLHPMYQATSGTRGMIAIAKLDSLSEKDTQMVKYVKELEARRPGSGVEALLWAYTDNPDAYKTKASHVGFPEISIYPYRTHQGIAPLTRDVPTDLAAQRLLEQEARKDNLNYLPLATITKDATVDMINGHFSYERLGLAANAFTAPALQQQPAIEQRTLEFVDRAQTEGLTLPLYGKGKMQFDTRTGFFVMRQMVPGNYLYYLTPLDTPEAHKTVRDYMIHYRTFNPAKISRFEGALPRQFIFNRPPNVESLFKAAGFAMPANISAEVAHAGEIVAKNTANAEADAKFYANRDAASAAAEPGPELAEEESTTPTTPPNGGARGRWPTRRSRNTHNRKTRHARQSSAARIAKVMSSVWRIHKRI